MLAQEGVATSFPVLTVLVLLPAVGALVVAFLSTRRPELVRLAGLVFTVSTGALTLWLLAGFETGEGGYQFVSRHQWIEEWGISWHLGVDDAFPARTKRHYRFPYGDFRDVHRCAVRAAEAHEALYGAARFLDNLLETAIARRTGQPTSIANRAR